MFSLFNLSSMLISLCSPNTFNYVSTSYLNVKEMITTSDNNSYNSELREIGESLDVGYKREQILICGTGIVNIQVKLDILPFRRLETIRRII